MYIELVIIFNIYIDFLIIIMTSILMKEKVKTKKIILSSLLGGLSSLLLLMKITIFELLIFSVITSLIIVKISFSKLKSLIYFYFNSILIGGIIFLFNNYFKLNVFENYLILLIITPFIVITYKFKIKELKENYNFYYQIKINYNGQNLILKTFLDSGNKLIDPYFNRPVILINEYILKNDKYFYIPYSTITESGIIKAIHLDEIEIIGLKKIKNVVVGLLPKKLMLNNIDCLLNIKLLEECNV